MNDLQIFDYQDSPIRTLDEEGMILFCASDVAKALGYAVPHKAVRDHCKGVLKRNTLTNGGIQEINFIPESDVYRLIISSKLPSAERFERWVFEEVLPTIRKSGSYGQQEDNKIEIARLIASCKSASAVKAICALYEIGKTEKPIQRNIELSGDTVSTWLETIPNGLWGVQVATAYTDYLSYCRSKHISPVPLSTFSKSVHQLTGLVVKRKRINGRLEGFYYNV